MKCLAAHGIRGVNATLWVGHSTLGRLTRSLFYHTTTSLRDVAAAHTSIGTGAATAAAATVRTAVATVATVKVNHQPDHLDPSPESYSSSPFVDGCNVDVFAGDGGHGCISFVREKYIPEGPPNGGDGGTGGSIYVQAVRGETSLHKLARKRELRAGRGRNGKGKYQGGERGENVLITVPIGTVVKEISRLDPVQEEKARLQRLRKQSTDDDSRAAELETAHRKKLVMYPGSMRQSDFAFGETLVSRRVPKIKATALQPAAPIRLDLDSPTELPILLAAGAAGGMGNPHFVTKDFLRPKFATRGEGGIQMSLSFELKMLADVGLVGLPNAGKSTLLRSLSNSRTRIGSWAFTTLQPKIGTVVLDDHQGRPAIQSYERDGQPRTAFTIADIPGLIEGAHMDKGLGHGFLRHVERARILAFVIDLSAGDAVEALKTLWSEVGEYEALRARQLNAETQERVPAMSTAQLEPGSHGSAAALSPLALTSAPISAKPWFVIGTKADRGETQANFGRLKAYLGALRNDRQATEHPSGNPNGWRDRVTAVAVSAINAQGVHKLPQIVVDFL